MSKLEKGLQEWVSEGFLNKKKLIVSMFMSRQS